MNFLVDNQLPNALCNFLTAQGHQSTHVLSLQMDEATDLEIWDYAANNDWIARMRIFSTLPIVRGDTGKFLWVRIGNCRKETLLQTFEKELTDVVRAFNEGNRIVEIR